MKLQIIVGSTRPNRTTPRLAKWIADEADKIEDVEAEIVDLSDYPLPILDEPLSPRFNPDRHPNPQAQRWMDKIAEGEAYIFVTPEYNHSIPGVLKNAIDYLTFEMLKKPATIASHGTVGGARATMHLKEILSESRAAVIPTQVAVAGMSEKISEEGILDEEQTKLPYGPLASLSSALSELKWYSDALAIARARD
ncbi:MAG TPA: NAD(P)H-dependent oxidoreductase [Candidatus Saccharimonadales bacterium]|nr:NAD(P)H-dependent oxidoreductase [Candidatus Saccharimonadales bacterium]